MKNHHLFSYFFLAFLLQQLLSRFWFAAIAHSNSNSGTHTHFLTLSIWIELSTVSLKQYPPPLLLNRQKSSLLSATTDAERWMVSETWICIKEWKSEPLSITRSSIVYFLFHFFLFFFNSSSSSGGGCLHCMAITGELCSAFLFHSLSCSSSALPTLHSLNRN